VTDPFFLRGPAVVNFSGGRSSGLLLRRVLDAHHGVLPDDVHVLFANTGVEREETLDFVAAVASHWSVDIVWIERERRGVREVTYESASRSGEPFVDLITRRRYLPNAVQRFCTQELKIEAMRAWMRARGYQRWTSVVGLRRDEGRRAAKLRAREDRHWDVAVPLHEAGITKFDVGGFWQGQPFDLRLQSFEGNCTICFMKSRAIRELIARRRPDLVQWWIEQESRTGGRFHAHERGYADLLETVRRLPLLPLDLDPEDDSAIPCGCTDRRRSRCTCNARWRRGRGHALSCAMVLGRAA
jgi:3'-phosphoadenosine 5'-phosphosulfate sulfotransferase (PAPS reductase)/FAD synthetase